MIAILKLIYKLDEEPFNKNIDSSKKYNIIVFTECFEHLKILLCIWRMLVKVINKDGYMIVSLPNENTIYHRILSLIGVGLILMHSNYLNICICQRSNKVKIFYHNLVK